MKEIFVVAGIFINHDKSILLAQRSAEKSFPSQWEFPGGKVEPGEPLIDALKREIEEECGIRTKIIKQVGFINHAYSHFSITLYLYHCKTKGEPLVQKRIHKWITPGEIEKYAFPKANHKLFTILNDYGWYV